MSTAALEVLSLEEIRSAMVMNLSLIATDFVTGIVPYTGSYHKVSSY